VNFPKLDFLTEGPSLVSYVNEVLAEENVSGNVDTHLTGTVMIDKTFAESSEKDMTTLIPLMYLVIILLMWYFFRSVSSAITVLFIVFMSTAIAVGIFGYLGFDMNNSTAIAPTMIMTIVIADCVHFLTTVIQRLKHTQDKATAVRESLVINFQPIFLTTITTMVGYLSMNFSDSPPFRELGNLVTIGVFAGFFLAVYFLPAIIMILPIKACQRESGMSSVVFERLGRYVVNNSNRVALLSVGATIFFVAFIGRNEINDMFLDFFDEEMPMIKDTRFTVDNLTGGYSIEYSLNAGEEGGITNPEYLKKVEEFERWFQAQNKVIHVNAFTSIIRKINRLMHADDPAFDKIPDDPVLAAQYLLLYEMSMPMGQDLNNMVNMEKSATRFRVSFENLYTSELASIEQSANSWLKGNAPAHMYFDGTSTSVMFRYLSERNIDFMMYGFGIALLLIAFTIILVTRSVKFGILSLLPNILPSLVAFGIWGLLVGKIGFAVAFVTAFNLGILVDATFPFVTKYLRAKRSLNYSPKEAIVYSFKTVGASLFNTSVILALGFAVLNFSPFQINSSMGVLCAVTITVALLLDFFLLPVIILKIEKDDSKEVKLTKPIDEPVVLEKAEV